MVLQITLQEVSAREEIGNVEVILANYTSRIVHYSVNITPPPLDGPTNTTQSSVSVALATDTLYNITFIQTTYSQYQIDCIVLSVYI